MNVNYILIRDLLIEVEKHTDFEIASGSKKDERVSHSLFLKENDLIQANINTELNNRMGITSKGLTPLGIKLQKQIKSDPSDFENIIKSHININNRIKNRKSSI